MTRKHRNRHTTAQQTEVQFAYQQLLDALSRADRQAVQVAARTGVSHEQVLNLEEAGAILHKYPQLQTYLASVKERETAQRQARHRPDVTLASPTGAAPQAYPIAAYWSGSKSEPVGVPNSRVLRNLADTDPWVRAAINLRRLQVGRADIDVVPLNPLKPYNKKLQKRIRTLLNQPNEYRDTYRSLIEPVIEDILVLDRGVLTKSMTPGRERLPQALYYEDGATISIYPAWDGNPNSYRYLYEEPGGTKQVPLRNDECVVFIMNQASHRYGLSPVQVLYDTIQADLAAAKSGKRLVEMKPPPHLIHILNATESQIRSVRAGYEADIAGNKEVLWMGGPVPTVQQLTQSAKDNQWLEWQEYLVRKICAVFQVSPQMLGMTFDINKSTGQVQQQIYEDTGFIPLLLLLEEQLNRELLADFAPRLDNDRADLDALNLRVVYPEVSQAARQMHAEKAIDIAVKGMAGLPSMTLNQVLAMRGEQPVNGGNTFYYPSPSLGPIPWLSYDGGNTGDYTPPDTGGAQGSQDPASGLVEEDAPQQTNPESNEPTPVPQQPPPQAATQQKGVRPTYTAQGVSEPQTGIMLAFMLYPEEAAQLAQPQGEPAATLHITLAYMGETTDAQTTARHPVTHASFLKQLVAGIASEAKPLSGMTGGIGRFTPAETEQTPLIALVDVPGLAEFRTQLVNAVKTAGFPVVENHGYTPHITLAYLDRDAPTPALDLPNVALTLDRVCVAIGGTYTTFPMGDEQYSASWDSTLSRSSFDGRMPGKRWLPSHMR